MACRWPNGPDHKVPLSAIWQMFKTEQQAETGDKARCTVKQFLVMLIGSLAGLAMAQSVNWDVAYAACPAETSAYHARNRSLGQGWQQHLEVMKRYWESQQVSEKSMGGAIEENQKQLRKPRAAIDGEFADLAVCAHKKLERQLQQSTQTAEAATAPAPRASSGRNEPDKVATQCVDAAPSGQGAIRNNCNQRVNLAPGVQANTDREAKVLFIACAAPRRPTEIEYRQRAGLTFLCTR